MHSPDSPVATDRPSLDEKNSSWARSDCGVWKTVALSVAGTHFILEFGPGHEATAHEVELLWGPLLGLSPDPALGAAGSAPEVIRLRFIDPNSKSPGSHPGDQSSSTFVAAGPHAAYRVSGDMTRALISRLAGQHLLLHAGAVELPGIGTVLVVGASGAGKSTATSLLGRHGRYLTDELTILHPSTHDLTAYPKPVSRVRKGGSSKFDLDLGSQGLIAGMHAEAPSQIVLLDREPSGDAYASRVPLAEALMALIPQTSSLWAVPGGLNSLARAVAGAGGALRARYSEAEQLEGILQRPPAPLLEDWDELVPASPSREVSHASDLVRVLRDVQSLAIGRTVIALRQGGAIRLDGVGSAVWTCLVSSGPLSRRDITERVAMQLGDNSAANRITQRAVDEMISTGWLNSQ